MTLWLTTKALSFQLSSLSLSLTTLCSAQFQIVSSMTITITSYPTNQNLVQDWANASAFDVQTSDTCAFSPLNPKGWAPPNNYDDTCTFEVGFVIENLSNSKPTTAIPYTINFGTTMNGDAKLTFDDSSENGSSAYAVAECYPAAGNSDFVCEVPPTSPTYFPETVTPDPFPSTVDVGYKVTGTIQPSDWFYAGNSWETDVNAVGTFQETLSGEVLANTRGSDGSYAKADIGGTLGTSIFGS